MLLAASLGSVAAALVAAALYVAVTIRFGSAAVAASVSFFRRALLLVDTAASLPSLKVDGAGSVSVDSLWLQDVLDQSHIMFVAGVVCLCCRRSLIKQYRLTFLL